MKAEEDVMNFLERLSFLLKGLLVGKQHVIMQKTRPGVILAPLQIGLGVQVHHHFS